MFLMFHGSNTFNHIYMYIYTGCLKKNGAVLKINKKFISHHTRAKRTPSAAVTVQVFYALIIILNVCTLGHTTHIHTIIEFVPYSMCTVCGCLHLQHVRSSAVAEHD
jgi:protein-S-isoprenylcysteine O-methyltransferase Ste14